MAWAAAGHERSPERRVRRGRLVRTTATALVAALTWTLAPLDTPVRAAPPISSASLPPATSPTDRPTDTAVEQVADADPGSIVAVGEGAAMRSSAIPAPDIVPLQPARVLETRPGERTEDGRSQLGRPLAAGSTTEIPIAGRVGVADDAAAVVVYVSAIGPADRGFFTLFPCEERPLASSLNYPPPSPGGRTVIGNEVIAKLSTAGSLCVYTRRATHMAFDVVGYIPASSKYVPIEPTRLLDTRPGEVTADRRFEGIGTVGARRSISVPIAGRGDVPADAAAAVINVTAVKPADRGFITMYPCRELPLASSLNYLAGDVVGNEVIAKLDDSGSVCAFSRARTHLVFDVVGYIPSDAGYESLDPVRLLETRPGLRTADRRSELGRRLGAGTTTEVQISGRGGVADDATAAVINVSAINPVARGFFTVFPCNERPLASSLNYQPGRVRGNEIVAKLSASGTVCIFTRTETHAVFDVVGAVVPRTVTPPVDDPPVDDPPVDDPPPVATGRSAGWHLVPESLLFTEPGERRTVEIIRVDADGNLIDTEPPPGTTIVGHSGAFVVGPLDGNRVTLTAPAGADAELFSVTVPGSPALALTATSARLQPGVRQVTDEEVVFPPPSGEAIFDTEPFTRAEIAARTSEMPEGVDVIGLRRPFIIDGGPIPTGTLVVNDGDNDVMGRVVETPGLPTLTRGGRSLITVELVALEEIYADLSMNFGEDDLLDLGLVTVPEGTYTCDESTPAEDCASVQEFFDGPPASPQGFRRTALPGTLRTTGGGDGRVECEADEFGGLVTQAKVVQFTPGLNSYGFVRVDKGDDGFFTALTEFGIRGQLSATFEFTLSLGQSGSVTCKLYEFKPIDIPTGPLTPYLTVTLAPTLAFAAGLTATGGPRISVTKKCDATVKYATGFEYGRDGVKERKFDQADGGCDPATIDSTDGLSGDSWLGAPALSVTLTAGFNLVLEAGARIGGKSTELLGEFLGEDDLGFFKLLTLTTGPRVKLVWENRASMLDKGKPGSRSDLVWGTTVSFGFGQLEKLIEAWSNVSIDLTVEIDFPDVPIPDAERSKLTKALEPAVMRATIDGETSQKVSALDLSVRAEDEIEFSIELKTDSAFFPELEGAEIYRQDSGGEWSRSTRFQPDWSVGGTSERPTLSGNFTVTSELCESVGSDGAQFLVVLDTKMYLFLPTPGWGGTVKLSCSSDLRFEPSEIGLSKDEPTKQIKLVQTGLDGETFNLAEFFNPGNGSVVSLDPTTTTFEADDTLGTDGKEVEIEVSLNCGAADEEIAEHQWTANVPGRTTDDAALLKIEANCTDDFFGIVEDVVIAPASVSFSTEGLEDDHWTASGPFDPIGGPEDGFLRGSESASERASVLSSSVFDPRKQIPIPPGGCQGGEPGLTPLPEERVIGSVSTQHRGSDTVVIIFPEKKGKDPRPGAPCPPPPPSPPGGPGGDGGTGSSPGSGTPGGSGGGSATGGAHGDPHIFSFDGLHYGAMTLGEYIYAEPLPGAPDGPRVVARHEFTAIGAALRPTSITAASVEVDGRTIEVYGREATQLRIDGLPVALAPGQSIAIGDDATLSFSGTIYRFVHPRLEAILQPTTNMRVDVTVANDSTYGGHLGIADGNPANDAVVRDLAVEPALWITYSALLMLEHGDELFEVAESWRITDPFDSPFSITSDVFSAVNPPRPGTELLEPFRVQARQLLGALASICDTTGTAGSYDVDLFAIELSIGNDPVPATCDYVFRGRVVTDPLGLRVPAATVVIDAPGLEPCTSTTNPAGAFHCDLVPDLDELDAAPATFPLPYTIEVTPSGAPGIAATVNGEVATAAAFGGGRLVEVGNVTVPVDSTKTVQLTGTLRELGEPLEASTRLDLVTEGGSPLENTVRVESDVDGVYSTAFALPLDSTSVTVDWRYGVVGDAVPSTTFDDLVAGINDRTFDPDYAPVELTVRGTALYNGEPLADADFLLVSTRTDGSEVFQRYRATPDAVTGAYEFIAYLPVVTSSVLLTTEVGSASNDVIELTHIPPATGTDEVTFDIELDAPVLDISGILRRNGVVPASALLQIEWNTAVASRSTIRNVPVDAGTAEFDLVFDLPADATSASVRALTGVVRADDPLVELAILNAGLNPVRLDGDVVTPVLDVFGTVLGGTVGAPDPFMLQTSTGSGFVSTQRVVPASDGSYSARVELPSGTTDATVTAQVGDGVDDWATTTPSALVDGTNPVPFDPTFDAVALVVNGTITLDGSPVVGRVTIDVSARDGGTEVLSRLIPVTTNADGRYTQSIILPSGVDEAGLSAWVGSFPELRPEVVVTGLADGRNERDVVDQALNRSIDVAGVFTSPPAFFVGAFTLIADQTLSLPGGSTDTRRTRASLLASAADGSYRAVLPVPELATEVDLTAELSAAPGGTLQLLDVALVDGINVIPFNGDVDLSVDLELRGLLVDGDGPFVGDASIRYITRNGVGGLVDDVTVDVSTSVLGEFVHVAELQSDVRSIDVAWLVGIDGEAPVFRSFTGLFPGRNVRVFSDLYDPPIVEVFGTATRNGDPITEPLTVEIAVTDGATTSEQVTADASTGAYILTRTLERDADEVTVTISSTDPEDPTASITESVGGGDNAIELDLVSLRTALSIDGEMRLGTAPPAGLVDLRIAVTGAGQPDLILDQQVDPDDTDGTYRVGPLLLPRWAESVEVVAEIGTDPTIWPSTTLDGLVAGDDVRTFDAVVAPTIVDLGGLIDVGGIDVEAGDLDVQLEWLDVSLAAISTENLEPSVTLGTWSLEDQQAPTGAVALRATATVDVAGTAPIAMTFDPLIDDLVFDLVWTPTDVTLNGAVVFGDDGVNGDVRIQIITEAPGGVRIAEASSDETITVGTDGAWTTTISTFREIDEIQVRSYPIPATTFVSLSETFTVGDIAAGAANTLDVLADFDHRAVRVEGLLEREGAPITAGERLDVRVYRQGQSGFFETTAETGEPAADGSYRSDRLLLLPSDTERFEVGWSLIDQNLANDQIWQSVDVADVGRGVSEVEFNDDHVAKRVDLFGNLEIDDQPAAGDLGLRVTWTQRFEPNGVFPQTRFYDFDDAIDANGDYRVELVGPRNADIVLVEWRQGVSFEDYPEARLEPLVPGVNQLPFTTEYITTELRLMGTVQNRGVPPTAESISVEAWDADGRSLGGRSIALGSTFTPGSYDTSTGEYDVLVDIPSRSAEIRLTLRFNGPFDPYRNFTKTITTTPGTVNENTFDARSTSVLLSGLVSSDGTALADTAVGLDIEASNGPTTPSILVNLSEEVFTDASGRYSTLVYLPTGTSQITVTSDIGGAPAVVDRTIQSPGEVPVTADFDGDPATGGVVLDGFLTVDGAAAPSNPVVTIVTFDDEGDIFSGPSLTELDRVAPSYVYGADGSFDVASAVDLETDFVQVIVEFVGAPDVPYIRTFDVRDQTLPYEFTLLIDDSPSALEYSGVTEVIDEDGGDAFECDFGGGPFMFDLIVSARPTGGPWTEVGSSVMLIDDNGDTGFEFFPFNAALPTDTNELLFEISTFNYYDSQLVEAEYAFLYDDDPAFGSVVVPGGLTAIDDYLTADCDPGEFFD